MVFRAPETSMQNCGKASEVPKPPNRFTRRVCVFLKPPCKTACKFRRFRNLQANLREVFGTRRSLQTFFRQGFGGSETFKQICGKGLRLPETSVQNCLKVSEVPKPSSKIAGRVWNPTKPPNIFTARYRSFRNPQSILRQGSLTDDRYLYIKNNYNIINQY